MTEPTTQELDPATRAQVAEFLRMTPAERLRSLVNTVNFIERARARVPRRPVPRAAEPGRSGR